MGHIDQTMRTRNFRTRTKWWKEEQLPRVKMGEKPAWRGKWQNAISGKQWDNVRKETHEVSVMIQRLETYAIRDKKDNRLLLHQERRHRLTGRHPQKVQAAEERGFL